MQQHEAWHDRAKPEERNAEPRFRISVVRFPGASDREQQAAHHQKQPLAA